MRQQYTTARPANEPVTLKKTASMVDDARRVIEVALPSAKPEVRAAAMSLVLRKLMDNRYVDDLADELVDRARSRAASNHKLDSMDNNAGEVYLVVLDRGGIFGAWCDQERALGAARDVEGVVCALPILADFRPEASMPAPAGDGPSSSPA